LSSNTKLCLFGLANVCERGLRHGHGLQ
jgi:hypothetical protein